MIEDPWPQEEGWYWLYGWRSERGRDRAAELYPVHARRAGSAPSKFWVYVAGGTLMFPSEGGGGRWFKAALPEVQQ